MKKIKENIIVVGVCGVIFLYASFGFDIIKTTPDHSLVFVQHQNKEYISPPCLMNSGYDNQSKIIDFASTQNIDLEKKSDIKGKGYKPFSECRDSEGFTQTVTAGSIFLNSIGLFSSSSRWNDDGSWNY